jgi:molybdopterin-guanine dinucleotide biosynthesis protein A
MSILGVVMAGGRNTRFGDIKAFADVNGRRIIDGVVDVLRDAATEVVISANDQETYAPLGLPMRGDVREDLGPLSGIYTALLWARERGDQGILAVACDMPFPSAPLLRAIAAASAQHDAVLPESDGRRGLEPLFAYYSVNCIAAIDAAIAREDRRMISFHQNVDLYRLPIEQVRTFGDPAVLFMNVNTPADLEAARRISVEQPS